MNGMVFRDVPLRTGVGKDDEIHGRVIGSLLHPAQAARQILLTGSYHAQASGPTDTDPSSLAQAMERGSLDAEQLVAAYCRHLHRRLGTHETVAKHVNLDRRPVKKHITQGLPLKRP